MCPHIGWRVSWSAEVIWVFLESTALNYGSSWPWLLVEIGAQISSTWAHSRSQAERAVATQKKFYSKWCTGTREQVETWKAPKRSETITSIHIQFTKASHLIKTSFPLPIASVWMVGRIEPAEKSAVTRHSGVSDIGKVPKRRQQIHRTENCLERLAHRG